MLEPPGSTDGFERRHLCRRWNTTLATNATQLGTNAAEVAHRMGVGIEIDYEESSSPNLAGLQSFIDAYRSYVYPVDHTGTQYDATGANPASHRIGRSKRVKASGASVD